MRRGELSDVSPEFLEGARGAFFCFQAEPPGREKMHFWKYVDLKDGGILDNRYLIANLIACDRDTPRVVDAEVFGQVFDLQERAIADIITSFQEQQALEAAPKTIDPIQQTVATAVQGYINHPDVNRQEALEAIRFLNQPMMTVQVKQLRSAYKEFQDDGAIESLLQAINTLREKFASQVLNHEQPSTLSPARIKRSDLQLICFDVVSGG